ncbi:MAG: hypothetical protein JOZ58_21565 [Acetobacteraceae bacterium]|nr:hypothetical protein [Acetobacteraceae bacterium]
MRQIDPPAAIKGIEAFDDVVGLAGAADLSKPIGETSPFPARAKRCHRPKPGLFRVPERLSPYHG